MSGPAVETPPLELPYPNLGPESMPPGAWSGYVIAAVAAGAIVVILCLSLLTRLIRRRPQTGNSRPVERSHAPVAVSHETYSGRDGVVRLAETVRNALAVRLGEGVLALSTEEIASDLELVRLLGEAGASHCVALLRMADRAKFSCEPGPNDPTEDDAVLQWAIPAAADWLRTLGAAGARSTMIG